MFLPLANGGWIASETAPHPEADYDYNKEAAQIAEEIGLDFIMSMMKWRGFGGTTDHWGRSLESMTMMAGLAEATERVKIWATVNANVHNPAVAAKMFVTLDRISHGRAGMNIVAGAYPDEFRQMGLWEEDLSKEERYRKLEEWTTAVTRLWAEGSVTMHGEYYTLTDCQSRPHPINRPTIISAGASPSGRAFQSRFADGAFLSAENLEEMGEKSREVHDTAAAMGRRIKTYSMLNVVMAETDARAQDRVRRFGEGIDREALANMRTTWGWSRERVVAWAETLDGEAAFQTPFVSGAPDTVVERILTILETAELDGLMLIFPDYHADMRAFGEAALPRLRAHDAAAALR